jgi:hypothetical protein
LFAQCANDAFCVSIHALRWLYKSANGYLAQRSKAVDFAATIEKWILRLPISANEQKGM